MSEFHRKVRKWVNLKEINESLDLVFRCRRVLFDVEPDESDEPISSTWAFIQDKEKYFYLTYGEGGKVMTKIFNKATGKIEHHIDGMEAFRRMQCYYKLPRFTREITPAGALLYSNPDYEGKWVEAIEYDVTSAFSAVMIHKLPDFSVPPREGMVKKDEIGFSATGELVHEGYAPYIWPLVPSYYKKFVQKYFNLKKKGREKGKERVASEAKDTLNLCIGYCDKHNGISPDHPGYRPNPFFRNYIVYRCNEEMEKIIEAHKDIIIMSNTDSLVSLEEIPELPLGPDVGQWKIEQKGWIAYVGNNYQWRGSAPKYRGVPKEWFSKDFDITKSPLPDDANQYFFNGITNRIERRKICVNTDSSTATAVSSQNTPTDKSSNK